MIRLLRFFPSRWWSPQAWKTWANYLHWRLETYGAYDANGCLRRPMVHSLFHQFPSYYRWLGDIDKLRK